MTAGRALAAGLLGAAALGAAYVAVQGLLNLEHLGRVLGPWARLTPVGGALGAVAAARASRAAWRGPGGPSPAPLPPGPVLAAGFCVFVVWVLVVQLALQPFDRLAVEASLGLAVLLWAGGLVPALRLGLLPAPLCAAALGVSGALVVAELGLRVAAVVAPTPLLTAAGHAPSTQLATHRFAPGEVRHGFACNADGYYDEPFRAAEEREGPLLAVIADSFGAGIVPQPLHFTTLLEGRFPGLAVYDFGVPAIGPPVYAELLEREVLPLDPDGVLVCLFVGNDLTDLPTASGRVDGLLRELLDGDRLLLRRATTRARALRRAGLGLARDPRRAEPGRPTEPLGDTLARMPWLVDPALEPPAMDQAAYLALIARRAPQACAPESWRVDAVLAILAEMAAAAAPRPFTVVLIPSEFQVEDRWWRAAEAALAGAGVPDPARDGAQRALGAGLDALGIAWLDLLPVLRAEPPLADGDRHLYHRHDTHFNARGNRVAARALAERLGPQVGAWFAARGERERAADRAGS